MEETIKETRVKMSANLNAKGAVQWDITSEFPTLNESAENLDAAIKKIQEIVKNNGYNEAGK